VVEPLASRRAFLRHTLPLTVALALPYTRMLRAQPAQPAPLATVRLSERMLVVPGSNANVLCADSNDGVILVDGGHASWADALLGTVASEFAGRPVRALINTHWHEEQTGANRLLGERGTEIVAHENTKLWLGTRSGCAGRTKYPPLPPAALPSTTFYDSGRQQIADRTLEYVYMRDAHTDGDLCVFFPEENVLVAGGFVSNAGWPIIDWWTGGWTVGMLNGFDRLLEVANERTRIVPAAGPVMSWADLKAQQRMYLTIFDRIHALLLKAYGTEEVLAAKPTAEYDAVWGDPTQFVTLAFQSTWGHLRDAHDTRLRHIA
jgi:glyoxylase-like metal-dependent hydrolase (beta-lactamase superfamily II)